MAGSNAGSNILHSINKGKDMAIGHVKKEFQIISRYLSLVCEIIIMLGMVFALLAAVCYGLAAAIQKKSMGDQRHFDMGEILKDRLWLSSILVGFVGIIFYLLALANAGLTEVQPFLSLSLIIPIIAGLVFFREKLGRIQWIAIVLVLAGIILVSV